MKYLLLALIGFGSPLAAQNYILDADTGNEMDDFYAIARALAPSGLPLLALQSAHFNNPQLLTDSHWHHYPTDSIQTLAISQGLNEMLKTKAGRFDLPTLRGCDRMLGYAWGYYPGAPVPQSPASRFIIEQAKRASPKDKLNVICLGPSTNVASALAQAPEIGPNLRVYLLGARYDAKRKAWNKNEFNVRNDLNAFDLLLNRPEVELWVMPASTAEALVFDRTTTLPRLERCPTRLCERLASRWAEVQAGTEWIMWDLALVAAILKPELAKARQLSAPPENLRKKLWVYTEIDADAMRADFWAAMEGFGE